MNNYMDKTLKDFVLQVICEEVLKQGGNAVSNVQRIAKDNIQPTLDKLCETIFKKYPNLKWGDTIFLLGSTGKKDFSGDIDIGIDFEAIKEHSEQEVLDEVKQLFKFLYNADICKEIKINDITNDMLHLAFPQYNNQGKELNENVQIDILITPNKKFCQFYMYSPAQNETKYKGAHRNELFRAIIKTTSYKPLKTIQKDGQDVVAQWEQQDMTSKGLYWQKKTLIDQNGNWLKYKDTDQDLIQSYAKVLEQKLVSGDPKEVINMLVGDYQFEQINSFEKLFNVIKNDQNFKYTEKKDRILSNAANAIKENIRLELPEELNDYL